jgi:hypothetical protein
MGGEVMAKKARTPPADWKKERTRKFQILVAADFTCAYCGSRPGSDHLHVDHLVPITKGGSDNTENLCCACETCNRRKSNAIIFPGSMVIGIDNDGFRIHRMFGDWAVMFDENHFVIEHTRWCYWFEVKKLHEQWFLDHISEKCWPARDLNDFGACADYAKRFIAIPSSSYMHEWVD